MRKALRSSRIPMHSPRSSKTIRLGELEFHHAHAATTQGRWHPGYSERACRCSQAKRGQTGAAPSNVRMLKNGSKHVLTLNLYSADTLRALRSLPKPNCHR